MSDFEHVLLYQVAAIAFILASDRLEERGRELGSWLARLLSIGYAIMMVVWFVKDFV